jgi:hypothetical protein
MDLYRLSTGQPSTSFVSPDPVRSTGVWKCPGCVIRFSGGSSWRPLQVSENDQVRFSRFLLFRSPGVYLRCVRLVFLGYSFIKVLQFSPVWMIFVRRSYYLYYIRLSVICQGVFPIILERSPWGVWESLFSAPRSPRTDSPVSVPVTRTCDFFRLLSFRWSLSCS